MKVSNNTMRIARDYGRLWRGYYMVDIPLSGQGNRRTRMAEAACNALKTAGYDAMMFSSNPNNNP